MPTKTTAKPTTKPAKTATNSRNSYSNAAKETMIADFLAAYEQKFNMALACRVAGVSRSTLWRWRRSSKKLDRRIRDITAAHIDAVEQTLAELVADAKTQPNARVQAARTLLEGRRPALYNRRPSSANAPTDKITFQLIIGSSAASKGATIGVLSGAPGRRALPAPNVIEWTGPTPTMIDADVIEDHSDKLDTRDANADVDAASKPDQPDNSK
jgi:transposase-like protein